MTHYTLFFLTHDNTPPLVLFVAGVALFGVGCLLLARFVERRRNKAIDQFNSNRSRNNSKDPQ